MSPRGTAYDHRRLLKKHVLILGAGFGGLELATRLSESYEDDIHVTLLDRNDSFFFGFSKLEVMLGRESADAVRLPYRDIAKDGVEFRQETVTGIDPVNRRVTTDAGSYGPDFLVVALGAGYDMDATPGLVLRRIDGGDDLLGAFLDIAVGKSIPEHLRDSPRHGHGALHREGHRHLHRLADALLHEALMQEERALERRRRTLEGLTQHGDEDPPAVEVGQRVAQPLGAGDGVVIEAARLEAGRRLHVVVGAHGHDEEVRVVGAGIGNDATGGGVDANHGLLAKLDALLRDVAVVHPHVVGRLPTEHDLELGEAEDERVVAVQQRDAHSVLQRLGKARRQLEPSKARTDDQDMLVHAAPAYTERRRSWDVRKPRFHDLYAHAVLVNRSGIPRVGHRMCPFSTIPLSAAIALAAS